MLPGYYEGKEITLPCCTATGEVEPEVNFRPRSTRHKDSLRGRVSELSGALSVSSTLHLSAIVWSRANETRLYSGAFPTNAQGVAVISAGPKMRGHISGQISSGFGITAASVTAMPLCFQYGSVSLGSYPHKTILIHFSVPSMSSAEDGLFDGWTATHACLPFEGIAVQ